MKILNSFFAVLLVFTLCIGCDNNKKITAEQNQALARQILADTLMDKVQAMALEVVKGGFNAGDGYIQVWIRDYNTFIELAMDVADDETIQENLLTFFRLQGPTGDIIDGFTPVETAPNEGSDYFYRTSPLAPQYVGHKNTVETDQESSLVQAVWRYVTKSGNKAFLQKEVGDKTVLDRMEWALQFLMNERYSIKYDLLWGATTADWGDVQPEHVWGVELDDNSHLAVDIYDNAFFIVAVNHFIELTTNEESIQKWTKIRDGIAKNVREKLWDKTNQKFIPHLYIGESPFPPEFDENQIYYHGGTAIAIEAGLLTPKEVKEANERMLANVQASGAPTIGLTLYPPYPEGYFLNPSMYPYGYQNGGDWTWFGGRMIQQLIRYNYVQEAYDEARPMFERVVKNNGFYEWYAQNGDPKGSGSFRGEAGVLVKCIEKFRQWANEQLEEEIPDKK